MTGEGVGPATTTPQAESSARALKIALHAVEKRFGGVRAVDGVSLDVGQGSVTAFLGPNGAGKTTLFNLITGLLRPDSGSILLNGEPLERLRPWEIARRGVGRVFQDVRILSRLSVIENVMLMAPHQPGERLWRTLLPLATTGRAEDRNRKRAVQLLGSVGLGKDTHERRASDLSYGQTKRLAVARLLAQGADLLLLDEPAAGLDPKAVADMTSYCRALAREGKGVLIVEHNLEFVRDVADRVVFMREGKVVADGPVHTVLDNSPLMELYMVGTT